MKVIKQEEFELLNRKTYELEIDHDKSKTPTKEEALKQISDFLKVKPELVKIKAIFTKYGSAISRVIANVYDSVENYKAIEEFRKKVKTKKEKKAQAKKE